MQIFVTQKKGILAQLFGGQTFADQVVSLPAGLAPALRLRVPVKMTGGALRTVIIREMIVATNGAVICACDSPAPPPPPPT